MHAHHLDLFLCPFLAFSIFLPGAGPPPPAAPPLLGGLGILDGFSPI